MTDGKHRYESFAAALRAEIEREDLASSPPDLTRVDQSETSTTGGQSGAIPWLAAAVLVLVIGGLTYPAIGAIRTRRLIGAESREFVETLFDRSLFDAGEAPNLPLDESNWFDADQTTMGPVI